MSWSSNKTFRSWWQTHCRNVSFDFPEFLECAVYFSAIPNTPHCCPFTWAPDVYVYLFVRDIYIGWPSTAQAGLNGGMGGMYWVKQNAFWNIKYKRSPQCKLQFTHKIYKSQMPGLLVWIESLAFFIEIINTCTLSLHLISN